MASHTNISSPQSVPSEIVLPPDGTKYYWETKYHLRKICPGAKKAEKGYN
jgi:hypothetical protein